jgi:hypothetical protein
MQRHWMVWSWMLLFGLVLALAPAPVAAQEGDDDDEEELEPPPDYEGSDDGGSDDGVSTEPEPGVPVPPPPPGAAVLDGPGPGPSPPPKTRLVFPRIPPPPDRYDPHVGFQMLIFFSGHPADTFGGASFSLLLHPAMRWSFSIDGRVGGGMDRDKDRYIHSYASIGGSLYHWFWGHREEKRAQPYARVGFGFLHLGDEHYDDPADDDVNNSDWNNSDWDKKSSRHFKKNGVSAPGHSGSYLEEAVGFRYVLSPSLGPTRIGASLDLELALVQDNHYGVMDSGLKFSFGVSLYF